MNVFISDTTMMSNTGKSLHEATGNWLKNTKIKKCQTKLQSVNMPIEKPHNIIHP